MNAAAVIVRELREESRRPANYWLRVLAAGALILVFASIMLAAQPGPSQVGFVLFHELSRAFLYALWVIVPLITADCVSREKREGTLGLLFLTPLTVLDVVAGKVAVHVLRALTLFLAAVPLLGLPVVLGGVDWRRLVMAATAQAGAVLLSIAAGIYASVRGGTAVQVMVLAEVCALALAALTAFVHRCILMLISFTLGWSLWWAAFSGMTCLWSIALFTLILRSSVVRLRNTWQQESSATDQPRWVKIFSNSEFWREFFYWNKGRTLDRNPMAWLQEYSWTARLTKWGWFILVLVAEVMLLLASDRHSSAFWQPVIVVAVGLGLAFSAVGSFRREQDNGVLELLLVTPLSERRLLRGRFWGICCHYLPACAVLWFGWTADKALNIRAYDNDFMAAIFPNPMALILIMVVGLYLSLSRLNLFLAWLLTWVVAFALPVLGRIGLGRMAGTQLLASSGFPQAFQLVLAALMWFLLQRKVRHREFAVGKSDRNLLI